MPLNIDDLELEPDDNNNDLNEEDQWDDDEDWGNDDAEPDPEIEDFVNNQQPVAPEVEVPFIKPLVFGIPKAGVHQIIDHDGVKIPKPNFNDWDKIIEEYVYETFPGTSTKKKLPEVEMVYKTILVNNKRHIVHIRCPKDNIDSDEVLWSKIANGTDRYIRTVDSLPKKLLDKIKGNNIKQVKPWKPAQIVEQAAMSNEVLQSVLDKYYTISDDKYNSPVIRSNKDLRMTRVVKDNHTNSTCVPYLYCNATVLGKKLGESNKTIRGFTTGRYNANTNEIEVIGCETIYNDGNYNSYSVPYNLNSTFKKYMVQSEYVSPLYSCNNEFIRIKIKDYKQSSTLFGNARIKKAMHGKVYNSAQFRYQKDYFAKKLENTVDVVDVLSEEGVFVKFLASDLEFMYIDPSKFTEGRNNKIKKTAGLGSKVKIVDNRRVKLEKGKIFTVISVIKNNSNIKNSRVTISNGNGVTHDVLLKQVRVV